MNYLQILLERVGEWRAALGISENAMLTRCGLDKNTMFAIRKGSVPSVDKVAKLADFFNVSVDYLLGRTEFPDVAVRAAPADSGASEYGVNQDAPDLTAEDVLTILDSIMEQD